MKLRFWKSILKKKIANNILFLQNCRKMNQANAILNSLENDTMNSLNDFSGSNSRVNDLNESKFRKMFNSWFSSES